MANQMFMHQVNMSLQQGSNWDSYTISGDSQRSFCSYERFYINRSPASIARKSKT